MKILIVDDEKLIRDVIKEYCCNENYEVLLASNGEEALEIVNIEKVDLIILDIMMPKLDGFSLCKQIKDKNIPIIILSARTDEFDKLLGFELGIDDYVTKPFSPKELIARVKAVLKRNNKIDDSFTYKTLVVDFKAHNIVIDGENIKFTPKEYDLLVYFINNSNIALTREILLDKIWGYSFFGDDRTIDTHIKMLRNTLGKYRDLIVTVRGVGYKFEAE
ncbi:MAG: response regulator transcription factor [Bacilli bacterium]|nr:response regulator transcription factor [Bacilli bacterium]MCI9433995.1 response regulator transcription factor [Bacilli bacterium]